LHKQGLTHPGHHTTPLSCSEKTWLYKQVTSEIQAISEVTCILMFFPVARRSRFLSL